MPCMSLTRIGQVQYPCFLRVASVAKSHFRFAIGVANSMIPHKIRLFLYIPDAFLFPRTLSDLADIKRAERDECSRPCVHGDA